MINIADIDDKYFLPNEYLFKALMRYFEGYVMLEKDRKKFNKKWKYRLSISVPINDIEEEEVPLILPSILDHKPSIKLCKRYLEIVKEAPEKITPDILKSKFSGENIIVILGNDNQFHPIIFDYGRCYSLFVMPKPIQDIAFSQDEESRYQHLRITPDGDLSVEERKVSINSA